MNCQILANIGQMIGGVFELAPVVTAICTNKKELTTWEKVSLVFQAISGLATLANGGQGLLSNGKNVSELMKSVSIAIQSASSFSHIAQLGLSSVINLRSGKAGMRDAIGFSGTLLSEAGATVVRAQELYTCIPNETLIAIIRQVSGIGGILLRGIRVVENITDYFRPKIVHQIPTNRTATYCFFLDSKKALKEQLAQFAETYHMQFDVLEKLVHTQIETYSPQFICPLSQKVIMHPLKHKTTGLFFDKENVESWRIQFPQKEFRTANDCLCDMEHDSFEESLDGREKLTKELRIAMNDLRASWHYFKIDVWKAVRDIFNTSQKQLVSTSYWPVDPRQWTIEYAKNLLSNSEKTQESRFDRRQSYEEVHASLLHFQERTIPGLLKQMSPFPFEPFNLVKKTLEDASTQLAPLTKRVRIEIIMSTPKKEKTPTLPPPSPETENQQELLPQRFQRMKEHVWTVVKGEFDTLYQQFCSKSYWPIDPRQWLIEFDKGVLLCEEMKQKARFTGVKTPLDLLEALYHLHDKTIAWYVGTGNFFADMTKHAVVEPFATVHRTLRSSPTRITPLINEVSAAIARRII